MKVETTTTQEPLTTEHNRWILVASHFWSVVTMDMDIWTITNIRGHCRDGHYVNVTMSQSHNANVTMCYVTLPCDVLTGFDCTSGLLRPLLFDTALDYKRC